MANAPTQAAGNLLRDARTRARLTQAELASRAGIAQSVISAYETGRRAPSLQTVTKLIQATGYDLVLDLTARDAHPPTSNRLTYLRRRREDVIACAARRGARNVRVFGSTARGDDTDLSDVDLLVDLDAGTSLLDIIALEDELAELLGTRVEVVSASSLRPHVHDAAMAEALPL